MYEPLPTSLTIEVFLGMDYSQILYAEITAPGGMGMAGGILLFVLEKEILASYSTNYFINTELYELIKETILKYTDRYVYTDLLNPVIYYNFCYGGMGNDIFLKADTKITISNEQLEFSISDNNYFVKPSVLGIFNSISKWLEKRIAN